MSAERIGIVGGGQLGRMLTESAKPMGFEVSVLDPSELPCPAAQAGAEQITGTLDDPDAISELVLKSAVTTWEIEHIDSRRLMALSQLGHKIEPSPYDLLIIQDKLEQKDFLARHGIPLADHCPIDSPEDLETAISRFGSVIVKSRTGGYDGRGNLALDWADWAAVQSRFADAGLYAERVVPLQKELSVLVARDLWGSVAAYPVIETIQRDGQCDVAVAPARIEPDQAEDARELALETLSHLQGAGVFAIEMFLTNDDEILVNEIAPRVHNSGHLTMEANITSQFEQHIRAISGLPLGRTDLISPAAMANILGERDGPVDLSGVDKVLDIPDAHLHIYGKRPTKVARKMGHITVRANTANEAVILATNARRELTI